MNIWKRRLAFCLVMLLGGSIVWATKLAPLNLEQLCRQSGQIYRGTVVSVEEKSIEVGGGSLPSLSYTIRVDESFKGTFDNVKGHQVAILRTIGTLKQQQSGRSPIPGFPVLKEGQEYLLMVAPKSVATGLTSTVGLGQGCFELDGKVAVNLFNNFGLFRGMSSPTASGPLTYDQLRQQIKSIVGGGQ
ncbi:MAG TPA: hypothetical protein VLV83_21935 [Acidobacteriota bacterium]|nr:hypothetical protein [Acidobacteriota bacterium]